MQGTSALPQMRISESLRKEWVNLWQEVRDSTSYVHSSLRSSPVKALVSQHSTASKKLLALLEKAVFSTPLLTNALFETWWLLQAKVSIPVKEEMIIHCEKPQIQVNRWPGGRLVSKCKLCGGQTA